MFSLTIGKFFLCCCVTRILGFHSYQRMTLSTKLRMKSSNILSMDLQDEIMKQTLKEKIYLLSAKTSRGQTASPREKASAMEFVTDLEKLNPSFSPAQSQVSMGSWELIYSNTKLLRSSPLFIVIRSMFVKNEILFERFCNIYSEALKFTKIGRIKQIITSVSIQSEFQTDVSLIPGIKLSNTLISKAEIFKSTDDTWQILVENIKAKDGMLGRLSGIPINTISSFLDRNIPQYSTPMATIRVSYVDQDLRVTRDQDFNICVFSKFQE